jgi:hypothetical protein
MVIVSCCKTQGGRKVSNDLVKRLRICAPFDPDQAEAADRIEQLETALREISSVSKVAAKEEDMAQALTVLLTSHRKIALAALEGKKE